MVASSYYLMFENVIYVEKFMIIQPVLRNFICFTAHPDGCKTNVQNQINRIKNRSSIEGPKNVLVIGSSGGYGLASQIVSTYASGAKSIGVFFERPADGKRTASAGYYNSAAFQEIGTKDGIKSWSINGDAFSNEVKDKTINLIKEKMGKVDLVIYSLATPKRTMPDTGETIASSLKPIGEPFTTKTLNFSTGNIKEVTIKPATEEEIKKTVSVMGGEDWELWMDAMLKADVLDKSVMTLAYSYIGPNITQPIYWQGTIGQAKTHLESTAEKLNKKLENLGGKAYVSVNKALVTQASSALPGVSLYISFLYEIMKKKGTHEDCIDQIYRLFKDFIYNNDRELLVDEKRRIRLDDLEMEKDIQEAVDKLWERVTDDNIKELCDLDTYRKEFYQLFGFEFDSVDYEKDVDPNVSIDLV